MPPTMMAMHSELDDNPHPLPEVFLQVHITSHCNAACTHCYMIGEPQKMSLSLFRKALRQFDDLVASLHPRRHWLQITGGEPLMHSDIWNLLSIAAQSFSVKLLSNGMLITPEIARQLQQLDVSVQISFDGLPPTHDQWRGAGAFERAWQGLMNLRAAGSYCSARMTVGRDNQEEVDELFKLLSPHVDAFHVSRIVPMGKCTADLPDTACYRRSIYHLYNQNDLTRAAPLRDPFFGVLIKTADPDTEYRGCSAGLSGLCVTETGAIYPCRRLPIELGNVAERNLLDIYNSHPLLHALRRRDLQGACGKCEDKQVCGGSRCIAYALTGNPLASDPGCIFQ
jgi:AdoMet-dependent heme synthase